MKYETSAKRLIVAMARKGIIAQELADRTGVHKSSISQYVNGSHAPSNINAGKMAEVLEVSPVWLMGYDVPMLEPKKHPGECGTMAELECIYRDEAESVLFRLNEENVKKAIGYMEKLYALQKDEEELQ